MGNYRLQVMDSEGRHERSIVPPRTANGDRPKLTTVQVSSAGLIHALDVHGARLFVYTREGELRRTVTAW